MKDFESGRLTYFHYKISLYSKYWTRHKDSGCSDEGRWKWLANIFPLQDQPIVTGQIESDTVNIERAIGTVDAQMKDFESGRPTYFYYKISRDTHHIAQKHQNWRYMYQGLWHWAYFHKSDRPRSKSLGFDVKKLYM